MHLTHQDYGSLFDPALNKVSEDAKVKDSNSARTQALRENREKIRFRDQSRVLLAQARDEGNVRKTTVSLIALLKLHPEVLFDYYFGLN